MDPNNIQGMSEAQRQAAIRLARQKVMATFSRQPENYIPTEEKIDEDAKDSARAAIKETAAENLQNPYAQTMANEQGITRIDAAQWKKYHSAWQNYYQKYYEGYYTKAIKENSEKQRQNSPEEEGRGRILNDLRRKIRGKVSTQATRLRKSRHFVPIISGVLVLLIFLFLQYNRNVFAAINAYISPGNSDVGQTGIVELDPSVSTTVGPESKLIIPKINIEVPIVFGIGNDHASQQRGMQSGVTHFAIPGASSVPGQIGNTVISGHSSNDVFDNGSYKFIFAQLERLGEKDTIYINYEGVRYTYAVVRTEVVLPTDVGKLIYNTDKPMLTLITCTPLGSAKYRLLVVAEQVGPSPETAKPATPSGSQITEPAAMPSNSPTFIDNVINFFKGLFGG